MVMIGKECLELDIWPEIADQVKSIEDIMRRVWATETYVWQKVS